MVSTPSIERRRRWLGEWIDVTRSAGLEIGPLDRPIVQRDDGVEVYYLDHLDTEGLHRKYRDHEGRVLDDIVPVDYPLGEDRISEVVDREVDYVVASHVVEHVPDVIGWLLELGRVLRPEGRVFLAVPDMRFTFDVERPLTSLGKLVEDHRREKTRPSLADVLDQHAYHVRVDPAEVWKARRPRRGWRSAPPAPEPPPRSFDLAKSLELAERATHAYVDCHCSVFTCESFQQLVSGLHALGLQPFAVEHVREVEEPFNDFLCTLVKRPAPEGGGGHLPR